MIFAEKYQKLLIFFEFSSLSLKKSNLVEILPKNNLNLTKIRLKFSLIVANKNRNWMGTLENFSENSELFWNRLL